MAASDTIRQAIAVAPDRLPPMVAGCVVARLTAREHHADLVAMAEADGTPPRPDSTAARHVAEAVALAEEVLALPPPSRFAWASGDGAVWRGRQVEVVTVPPMATVRLTGSGDYVEAHPEDLSPLPDTADPSRTRTPPPDHATATHDPRQEDDTTHEKSDRLPEPTRLVCDEPDFEYPSRVAAGRGRAHLRVWDCASDTRGPTRLAVVTEVDDGASVTNSATEIVDVLTARFGPDLVVLEHYNEASRSGNPNLSRVTVTDGHPSWQAVWPTSPGHPCHEAFTAWMTRFGHLLPQDAPA